MVQPIFSWSESLYILLIQTMKFFCFPLNTVTYIEEKTDYPIFMYIELIDFMLWSSLSNNKCREIQFSFCNKLTKVRVGNPSEFIIMTYSQNKRQKIVVLLKMMFIHKFYKDKNFCDNIFFSSYNRYSARLKYSYNL